MVINNPKSSDKSYKFMYRLLGIEFHRYLYHEGDVIEFIETEISKTGQMKDIAVKVDNKIIQITEFMSTPLYDSKLYDIFDYHELTRLDNGNSKFKIKTGVFSIANPNHGKNTLKIDENLTFHVNTKFTKNCDGWKVLNKLIYKTITQEELSKKESIDLLILPDMNITMPIKALMSIIIVIMGKTNIPDEEFRKKIILCEISVLKRFFKDSELSEMIEMLKTETGQSEVQRIVEKYGLGFDVIYFDGKADGYEDGAADSRLETAKNFLAEGVDEEIISRCTGISMDQIKQLKRKL